MLYLSKLKMKIYLIILGGLILFHISFLNSKTYTAQWEDFEINEVTEEQYQSCLNSLPFIDAKTEFISNTKINYFYNLPAKSLLYIYLGYFIIASAIIISAKFNLTESDNENK